MVAAGGNETPLLRTGERCRFLIRRVWSRGDSRAHHAQGEAELVLFPSCGPHWRGVFPAEEAVPGRVGFCRVLFRGAWTARLAGEATSSYFALRLNRVC